MSFEKDLRKAVESIDIPEELLPVNIEAMLRNVDRSAQKNTSADIDRSEKITAKKTNRTIIMRTIAAAAACIALAGGFAAVRQQTAKPVDIESEINYEAVQVQSYDELYSIYTGIYLNSEANSETAAAENGDGVEIITDDTAITDVPAATETTPAITEAPAEDTSRKNIDAVCSDFSDADIVKSDDSSIYYICGGTLYVVSKDNMAVKQEITTENPPFEMYVRGNSLVLVSEEKASGDKSEDGRDHTNVVIDIYTISSDSLTHIKTYKQNGEYNSARIDDNGVLYLVTGYSNYRGAPLDENADLDNYVPGYYIDGEKHYVAAEDITVPQGANNTDYTIISSVKCSEPVNISVKAVLGSNANAFCSDDTLYVAFSGTKDGKSYTAVTSFAISESGLSYKASGTVEGELISRYSMAESEGGFRIACRSFDENGMAVTDIYTLDSSLAVISKAEGLLPGVIIGSVKFDGNYASLIENNRTDASLVVDLDQSAPVENAETKCFIAPYVSKLSDGLMAGITACEDENGGYNGLRLELYSADSGEKISETVFARFPKVQSPALSDKKAMLIDIDNKIVGIPVSSVNEFGVKNQYFVFGYDENGFTQKGVFEYNDIDDSYTFERAVVTDGVLYIIGSGRMVSVDLDDMTVADTFVF
ncbi:MAG: beta-propeller domain-containing protein [Ruminococcus sp.]|nr:MAG: beta-propeller domain-containing protein [Ruminococcus sp.]